MAEQTANISSKAGIYSFDIFDTCLVRDVISPPDLFGACALRLRKEQLLDQPELVFKDLRYRAESEARLAVPSREISIAEIYSKLSEFLSWDAATSSRALSIELEEEERSLSVVPGMVSKVEACRAKGEIIFISDMYLPSSFLRKVLSREGLLKGDEKVYVSGEMRCSKSDGYLYDHVRKLHARDQEWVHFGDNEWADVRQAEKKGIVPRFQTQCHPTRYEGAMRTGGQPDAVEWKWSAIAGRMRSARLPGGLLLSREQSLWNIGASVTGPLLTSFVLWCLSEAKKRNIARLYFVSRDGQILHKIAQVVAPAVGSDIECRYLFGSRQAWHAASIIELSDRERSWIFNPDKALTFSDVARRLGLSPEESEKFLSLLELEIPEEGQTLEPGWQARIWEAMRHGPAADFILKHANTLRVEVLSYLEQELFFEGSTFAIVDVGWHGALQGSLMRMLKAAGRDPKLTGFYFGLFPNHQQSEGQELVGFWNSIRKKEFPGDRVFMAEIMMAADHGSVMNYSRKEGRSVPVLNREQNSEALDWGLRTHVAAALAFAGEASRGGLLSQLDVIELGERALCLFDMLCEAPHKDEAELMGGFPHAMDQTERAFQTMVRKMGFFEAANALLRRNSRPRAWWIEGQAAVTPWFVLRSWLMLRRIKSGFSRKKILPHLEKNAKCR